MRSNIRPQNIELTCTALVTILLNTLCNRALNVKPILLRQKHCGGQIASGGASDHGQRDRPCIGWWIPHFRFERRAGEGWARGRANAEMLKADY